MVAIADILEVDHGWSFEQSDAWLERIGLWEEEFRGFRSPPVASRAAALVAALSALLPMSDHLWLTTAELCSHLAISSSALFAMPRPQPVLAREDQLMAASRSNANVAP